MGWQLLCISPDKFPFRSVNNSCLEMYMSTPKSIKIISVDLDKGFFIYC